MWYAHAIRRAMLPEGARSAVSLAPCQLMRSKVRDAAVLVTALALGACADPHASVTAPVAADVPTMAGIVPPGGTVDVIVTFDERERDPVGRARALMQQLGGRPTHTYAHALKGFAARVSSAAVEQLTRSAGVTRVEVDAVGSLDATVTALSWGQDRLDQRVLPLDRLYSTASTGTGVRVYILDSGINGNHAEFAGRMLPGFSAFGDNDTADCHGHGTHVAGTAAGVTAGVARGAWVVPVRVASCTGSVAWSSLIAGLDWIASQKASNRSVPMVANISLGGSLSSTLNDAVNRTVQAGVVVVVSAGNSGADACLQSPAAASTALTTGATQADDAKASWSNFGNCVDLFAPGAGITSAAYGTNSGYVVMSGTSMAAPHVAGVVALILGTYPTYAPNQVRASMIAGATPNVVTGAGTGSPNVLLSSVFSATSVPADGVTSGSTSGDTSSGTAPSTPALTVSKQSTKSGNTAALSWSGVIGANVEVWRNGARYLTTANDGRHNDIKLPRGSFSYRVCAVGGAPCSATVTVTF